MTLQFVLRALNTARIDLESSSFWLFIRLLTEAHLLRVYTHLLHLINQLFRHVVGQGDIDLLGLALAENTLCILELGHRLCLRVVARSYSDDCQQRVEHGLAEASMRLSIVDEHLLDHFGRSCASKAT